MKSFQIQSASVLLVALLTTSDRTTCSATPVETDYISRISGGNRSEIGDFPYYVDMFLNCGGALIATDIVLTAAHCKSFLDKQINVGGYEEFTTANGTSIPRFCDEWIPHPDADVNTFLNKDWALCKLDRAVDIDKSYVRLVLNDDPSVPVDGTDLMEMGLGELFPGVYPAFLQDVSVPAVNQEECGEYWNGYIENGIDFGLTDDKMCTGMVPGKSSCRGDSGGPVIIRTMQDDRTLVDVHVGLTSYGEDGCPAPESNRTGTEDEITPRVKARTSAGYDWIRRTACEKLESVDDEFCGDLATAPKAEGCDHGDHELVVTVTTPIFNNGFFQGKYTSFQLYDNRMNIVAERIYYINSYENFHRYCLKKNDDEEKDATTEYLWVMMGPSQHYELILDGKSIANGSSNDSSFFRPVLIKLPPKKNNGSTKYSKKTKKSKK